MESLAKQGRTYLLVILSAIAVPAVLNVALRIVFLPQTIGITELIRFTLTVILVFFTFKGYVWARWITCILLLVAGVGGTLFASFVLAENRILGILLIILSMFYALSGMSLQSSEEIQSFFNYQKNNRQK
ncbi:MAG: hypothetical protein ACFBSE_10180 [Prochloraceae cyanobacterium]